MGLVKADKIEILAIERKYSIKSPEISWRDIFSSGNSIEAFDKAGASVSFTIPLIALIRG